MLQIVCLSPSLVRQRTKIGICWFSDKHTALWSSSKCWLTQNQNNVSGWDSNGETHTNRDRQTIDSSRDTIFASQGLRFGSPFSPPLADLEYILRIRTLIFHWLRLPVHVSNQKTFYTEHMLSTKCKQKWHRNALIWQRFATSRFGSNENIFPVCQSFETFTWLTVSASKLNWSQISFYSLGAAIFNSPTYV
jgi:hypothetical protein